MTKYQARIKEIIFMLIIVNTIRLWIGVFIPDWLWLDLAIVVALTFGYCWFTYTVPFHFRFTIGRYTLVINNSRKREETDDRT